MRMRVALVATSIAAVAGMTERTPAAQEARLHLNPVVAASF
jgi:hypothetical protein